MGEAVTQSPRCGCRICNARDNGYAFYREHSEPDDPARVNWDVEKHIANGWHAYRAAIDALVFSEPPQLPAKATVETFTAIRTPALAALVAWNDADWQHRRNLVVLAGPPGTGKTLAAVWLVVHRLADMEPIRFLSAAALARVSRTGEERDALLETARLGTLVVDDLGAERSDDRFSSDLDELVDTAYQGYGVLVMTTNLQPDAFSSRYGARVMDRFAERGVWIPCKGASMRARAGTVAKLE